MTDQKAKHTEGPWESVEIASNSGSVRHQMTAEGRGVVVVRHDGSQEGFANARLIAAAPTNPHDCGDPECRGQQAMNAHRELLEAAKLVVEGRDEWPSARGSLPSDATVAKLRAAIAKAERTE